MNNKYSEIIPKGEYCYKPFEIIDNKIEIKLCPYWSSRKDKPDQENGYCYYLKQGDWESEYLSLLWDMVKECNENL
jgi:hypothetical protein